MWFDLQTDFYRPLWIRVSIVAVCFGWAGYEFFNGGGLWAALFAFLGAVSLQQFFLDGWPASEAPDSESDTAESNTAESNKTQNNTAETNDSEEKQ